MRVRFGVPETKSTPEKLLDILKTILQVLGTQAKFLI